MPLYLGRTVREFAHRVLVPRGNGAMPRGNSAPERVVLVGDQLRLAYLSGLGSVRH